MRNTLRGVWIGGLVHSDDFWALLAFHAAIARDLYWLSTAMLRHLVLPLLQLPILFVILELR